jgi:uncharacterized phage-associated protein
MKTYPANQVADWFLSRINQEAGDTISPLKLQKLIYYAQAWHLAIFDTPLIEEDFQAWVHGPVELSQYHRFKGYGVYSSINIGSFQLDPAKFESQTDDLMNEIYDIYGEHNASYLENLTHNESPWIDARGNTPPGMLCNNVIPKESMKSYYRSINSGGQGR